MKALYLLAQLDSMMGSQVDAVSDLSKLIGTTAESLSDRMLPATRDIYKGDSLDWFGPRSGSMLPTRGRVAPHREACGRRLRPAVGRRGCLREDWLTIQPSG